MTSSRLSIGSKGVRGSGGVDEGSEGSAGLPDATKLVSSSGAQQQAAGLARVQVESSVCFVLVEL